MENHCVFFGKSDSNKKKHPFGVVFMVLSGAKSLSQRWNDVRIPDFSTVNARTNGFSHGVIWLWVKTNGIPFWGW